MANPSSSRRFPSTMEHTCQWVISQETEVPSDLKISINDTIFPLHKVHPHKVMESDNMDMTHIDLSDLHGGSEAFEKAVKFCYGINFEITVYNVAAILCSADYLEMTKEVCDSNLSTRIGEFLTQVALKTLPGAVVVLKSCEDLGSFAEKIGLVRKCVEAISFKACNEANFPALSPTDWWLSEITSLPASFLQKVLIAMNTRGVASKTLSTVIMTYAEITLPDFLHPLNSNLPLSYIRPIMQEHQVTSSIERIFNMEDGWVVCRMFKKKNILHKSSDISNSVDDSMIRNDGRLDQIIPCMGKSCEEELNNNMIVNPRKPFYNEWSTKLPALERYHLHENTNAIVKHTDHDYHVDVPVSDWAMVDRLVASQLNEQFDTTAMFMGCDGSINNVDEGCDNGDGDLWSLASTGHDQISHV